MATAIMLPNGRQQYWDQNAGAFAAAGTVNVYAAGTVTPITTWQDGLQVTANANPLTLDAAGSCSMFGLPGTSYKITAFNALGVQIWSQDNIELPAFPSTSPSGQIVAGQGRLNFTSGSTVTLVPFKGNQLTIAGVVQTIPNGGVALVSPAMTINTLYYIYAYMAGATMTLVASTVGHITDPTTGIEVWATDNTHTLVGMAYCTTVNSFTQGSTAWQVRSWFNDPGFATDVPLTANANQATTIVLGAAPTIEIGAGALRQTCCLWAGEVLEVSINGYCTNSTLGGEVTTGITVDTNLVGVTSIVQPYAASAVLNCACSGGVSGLAEGFHTVSAYGNPSANPTATWIGNATAGSPRVTLLANVGQHV
jgi:hypothetical protein